MAKLWSSLKPYLRWVILGGTLFFLAKTLKDHAGEVAAIRIAGAGWVSLAIAFTITLLAHTWSGLVWNWILQSFQQPVKPRWVIQVYLKTNIAKYLPGNVWHYYGRISAVTEAGGSLGAATLSVLLEPLLMAAAALLITLLGGQLNTEHRIWQVLGLAAILLAVHPLILNPILQQLRRMKSKGTTTEVFKLKQYPFLPFLGELGFVVLRGTGFLFVLLALTPVNPSLIPQLLSAFSLAWVLGLVVPGAPGGIGVFEATAIALLNGQYPTGLILSVVALFRMVSILAEVVAAGLATFSESLSKE